MEKRISELNQALELKDGCCFPIVQDGETKKVSFETLKTELKTELQSEFVTTQTLKVIPNLILKENQSIQLQLEQGKTYIFINSHVLNIGEVVIFAWFLGYPLKLKRISDGIIGNVSFSCDIYGFLTITATLGCRGYVYELNQTSI